MQFVTTKGEKTVTELAARVYGIPSSDKARLKQAGASLLKSNPALAKIQDLAAGTVVVVDESPGLSAAGTSGPLESAAGTVVQEFLQRLPQLSSMFDNSINAEIADIKATGAAVQNPQVQSTAANNAPLKEQLAKVSADLESRTRDAEALRALQNRLLPQLEADLNDLLKRIG